jgi:hypothetical protein|tara:strand:- start:1967 stop:2176 length:210 start_codon:yes stop_codon:yes gene_type:complete
MKKIFITSFAIIVFYNSKAFAYLDPGTGSIILNAILASIAAGATYCSIYWQKIKNFFNKKDRKKDKKIN